MDEAPLPPEPPLPPPEAPAPPESGASLTDFLRGRMELLERELAAERERARGAEGMLRQQEALRSEVETQLKAISEQIRREKLESRLAEDNSFARGRIEALEKRLDEMHASWAGLLKEAVARGEAGSRSSSEGVRGLAETLSKVFDEFAGLRATAPTASRRQEEDEKRLREHLASALQRVGEEVSDRLSALERRLGEQAERGEQGAAAISRERASLSSALEEMRHEVRQEYAKARLALESELGERVDALRRAAEESAARQKETSEAVSALRELAERARRSLEREPAARDAVMAALEQEKRDLIEALKTRNEQLRSYTLERREVERSLGESLMDLNRQLEAERADKERLRAALAALESEGEALKAEAALARKEGGHHDRRLQDLAAERDALAGALAEEAARHRESLSTRAASDRAWGEQLAAAQKSLSEEREARLSVERSAAELRAQVQTLADHIAKVLREKESSDARSSVWDKERRDLLETLRKKDEMIGMLSATFQNLLRKPANP